MYKRKEKGVIMSSLYATSKHFAGCASLYSGDLFWSVVVNKKDAYGKTESYDYGLMEPRVAMDLYDNIDRNLRRISVFSPDENKKMCSHEISKLVPCSPDTCPLGMGRCECWERFKLSCNLRVR